jgi:stearoyl-CoA desaturase (delta-9 desaturase)
MSYLLACGLVFFAAYLLNVLYITVFYHRGLTHSALTLAPWLRWWVVQTGNWITGLDPKGWCCMHRLHHEHSDTARDPHSPVNHGIFPLLLAQLHSYEKILVGLSRGKKEYTSVVEDLDFPVNWINRQRLWFLPYVLHATLAIGFALATGYWLMAAGYWLGMMSHPIQGWLVNSFGHWSGYRNFQIGDNSRNNLLVAWFVFGEGYQNNHHYAPASAKFSVRWWEFDSGYWLCWVCDKLGWIKIRRTHILNRQVWKSYRLAHPRMAPGAV